MSIPQVPTSRIDRCNSNPLNGNGRYVLYWMIANRRRQYNFALQRAVHWATELRKPLLIVEGLNCTYRWASTRIHAAILQGMHDNIKAFHGSGAFYFPFGERHAGHGKGMLATISRDACVVVTDDYPAFEVPGWIQAAASESAVLMERIDSNGIFPMRSTDRVFVTAHSFRRFLQKNLRTHLDLFPVPDPLDDIDLPKLKRPQAFETQWPVLTKKDLSSAEATADSIPVDHSVRPGHFDSGSVAANDRLKRFIRERLSSYAESHNDPDFDGSSGLSPHLHFGHLSAHAVFKAVMNAAGWSTKKLASQPTGSRDNWWGAGPNAEAFLEQLLTWRELGFNACVHLPDYDRYASLPNWAQATLAKHAIDKRPVLYSAHQLEHAETHDELWNAAQTQLLREGRIQNYLRMLWGKKILEWSPTPQDALDTLIHLNNKYALDGRDPNSYSGIFWILGRYDRPWGPERPIFGTVRYMSSENTARKTHVKSYIQRYKNDSG